jgi:transposase
MGTFRVIAKEVKDQVLHRIKNEGVSVVQAAKDAGISTKTIYTWLAARAEGVPGVLETARLKKENQALYEFIGKLTIEVNALKKKRTH